MSIAPTDRPKSGRVYIFRPERIHNRRVTSLLGFKTIRGNASRAARPFPACEVHSAPITREARSRETE